jgi:ATP-dependent RNA helicase DDX5/DBP2
MASAAAAAATARGPRYAPPDPTLPKPWRGLIDGNTGYLYFWNPETKAVQYDRPTAPPPSSPPAQQPPERPRNSDPAESQAQAGASRTQNAAPADDRARNDHLNDHFEVRLSLLSYRSPVNAALLHQVISMLRTAFASSWHMV